MFGGFFGYAAVRGLLPAPVFPAGLAAAGLLFCAASAAARTAARAVFYRAEDPRMRKPAAFLNLACGVRTLYAGLLGALCGLGEAAALLLPAAGTLGAYLLIARNGAPPAATLAVRCALPLQTALAAGAWAILRARFYLTPYLLCQNPLLPVREARRSSTLLCRGRLLRIAAFRLRTLAWLAAALPIVTLPFCVSWRGALTAAFCARLYGERRTQKPAPAVVFYVNGRSRFREVQN